MSRILLVDTFGIIFKSYYAFINKPLKNTNGDNRSAVFGFFKTLISIINKIKPDYCVVALEGKGECFRNTIYPEYKANRDEPPEDLREQISIIISILEGLGLSPVSIAGFEADDIIATASKEFALDNSNEVYIFSSDKDLKQLVSDNVKIVKTGKFSNEIIIQGVEDVISEYGITPSQITDYLALIGDSSDNIPGVRGIGPKTAAEILKDGITIEDLLSNPGVIASQKVREKIINGKESAILSKRLAQLEYNVKMDIELNKYILKPLNIAAVYEMLKKENLETIIKDIEQYNTRFKSENNQNAIYVYEQLKSLPDNYQLVTNLDDLRSCIDNIFVEGIFGFDLETTGLDHINDRIICLSIADSQKSFVVPLELSQEQQTAAGLVLDDVLISLFVNELKRLFGSDKLLGIAHNSKFDIKFLLRAGIDYKCKLFDTMLAEYILDGANNRNGLKELSEKYLRIKTIKYEDILPKGKDMTLLSAVISDLIRYSSQDAVLTYKLYGILGEKLEQDKQLKALYYNIELPVSGILMNMEMTGVKIDKFYFSKLSSELTEEIELVTGKIFESAGEVFNPNSPKQVGEILFDKLGLPSIKKTGKGLSTDFDVLQKLAPLHPIVDQLLTHRTLSKIKSTYADKLPYMINTETGKIHTTFFQTGTQTGRLSSRDPNLQNIPIKSDIGRKIRGGFIASEDSVILSADYSQIELFLLAEFSRDQNLTGSFISGEDIHTKTASLLFNKLSSEITKNERIAAKTVNFGVLYGQTAYGLSQELNIPRSEADTYIKRYFEKYNGVKNYIEGLIELVKSRGYAETYWGRKRSIPEINDSNKMVRSNGERMAVNTTIQGSAADLIKIAMIRIVNSLKKGGYKASLVIQVHDELIFDVPSIEVNDVSAMVKECMEDRFDFKLKLKTNIEKGVNWGELH